MPPSAPHAANRGTDSSPNLRCRAAIPSTIEKNTPPKNPGIASAGNGASNTAKNESHGPGRIMLATPISTPATAHPAAQVSPVPDEHRKFDQRHWRAMYNLAVGTHYGKPLSEKARSDILALLEEVRAGALPKAFVERTYIQHQLPHALNEWLSVAAVESVESALENPDGAQQIPSHIVEADLAAKHFENTVLTVETH